MLHNFPLKINRNHVCLAQAQFTKMLTFWSRFPEVCSHCSDKKVFLLYGYYEKVCDFWAWFLLLPSTENQGLKWTLSVSIVLSSRALSIEYRHGNWCNENLSKTPTARTDRQSKDGKAPSLAGTWICTANGTLSCHRLRGTDAAVFFDHPVRQQLSWRTFCNFSSHDRTQNNIKNRSKFTPKEARKTDRHGIRGIVNRWSLPVLAGQKHDIRQLHGTTYWTTVLSVTADTDRYGSQPPCNEGSELLEVEKANPTVSESLPQETTVKIVSRPIDALQQRIHVAEVGEGFAVCQNEALRSEKSVLSSKLCKWFRPKFHW